MTFDRMEQLKGLLITLECALSKYDQQSDIKTLDKLMLRLSLDFDTDETIERDCESFIASFDELMKRFNREIS